MSILFNAVIHVTGERDTGKSTFAIECGARPEKIALIGDDVKDQSLVKELEETTGSKFGLYINLLEEIDKAKMKEIQLHTYFLSSIMPALAKGNFDAIIFDTWTRLENTFYPYVLTKLSEFKSSFSPRGDIKGAEQWGVSFDYESRIINELKKYCKLLIFTTHLKTNKFGLSVPASKRPLEQNCDLRIWLRHNPESPAPIGLVLKRIAKRVVTDNGIETISVLPKRIVPCTWNKIKEYWNNPVANRQLEKHEIPNEFEIALMEGTLTADQKDTIRLMQSISFGAREEEEEENGIKLAVLAMRDDGKSIPDISKDLGITIQDIMKIISE